MSVLIIQNDSIENLGLYQRYLVERDIEHNVFHAYRSLIYDDFPEIESYDYFIIGPTPIPADKALEYRFLVKEWMYLDRVIQSKKPCLGVCCGGQILARKLGARIRRCKTREMGIYSVALTEHGVNDPLFSGFPEVFPVFQWHRDMFEVPQGGEILVRGEPCPIQGFRYRNIRGLIFHLEIDTNAANSWMEAYPSELQSINKTKNSVLKECKKHEIEMSRLANLLMDNFLNTYNKKELKIE